MRVVATRRDVSSTVTPDVDAVYRHDQLHEVLGQADVVALTCPLTPATENLIDAAALAAMKPTAHD
jgi:D-2-hydroxyacid dehydrogenase (NADP+)